MDEQGYNNLVAAMEEGSCALILGPEFFLLNNPTDYTSFRDAIYKLRLNTSPYVMEDGFFNTHKLTGLEDKSTILRKLKTYFRDLELPGYYEKVAELPFSLAISMSPDDLLARAMTAIRREYEFCYYKKDAGLYMREVHQQPEEVKWVARDISPDELQDGNTFLFNFLGIYSDTDSLNFTYDAFFEFLYSTFLFINNDSSLNLRKKINDANHFLFLGFGYDKWYLKLIFFILEKILKSPKSFKAIIINGQEENKNVFEFYENQFQLNFFNEGTLEFIERLHKDCEPFLKKPVPDAEVKAKENKQYQIQFFTSNPRSLVPLDHIGEFKKIKTAHIYLTNEKRDEFLVSEIHHASRQKDLLLKIQPAKPELVVISMHGSRDTGLLFQGEQGEKDPLKLDELLADIKLLTQDPLNKLQCIIFSCCHTAEFAEKVTTLIPYAIGIRGAIEDAAMPEFMEGFFTGLFADKNIKTAFELGKRLVERNDKLSHNAAMIELYPST